MKLAEKLLVIVLRQDGFRLLLYAEIVYVT